jgi:hypothetical protein
MHDAVAVPLIERAVTVMGFRKTAAAGQRARLGVGSECSLHAFE